MRAQKFAMKQFVSWKNVTKEECEARSLMAVKQDVKLLNEEYCALHG